MLKRDITYEDFDGEKVTETFYFNLTRSEIIELEVGYKGGLQEALQRIVKADDKKTLIAEFKKIVLLAYGVKSDDGKRFIKNDELREEFSQTAAYDALFMELATSDDAAATFIRGVVPKDFAKEVEKIQDKPMPPALPTTKE
ncbi:MAG: hypothetical protein ABWY25_06310 [Paenisporosarcina sp.]